MGYYLSREILVYCATTVLLICDRRRIKRGDQGYRSGVNVCGWGNGATDRAVQSRAQDFQG